MMRWGLCWLLSLTHLLLLPPAVEGLGTYYAEPYIGRTMKNGAVYTGQDLTLAVPWQDWEELGGEMLLICTDDTCIMAEVTDTGLLAESGVALDLSVCAFQQLATLDVGVVNVRAWVIQEANDETGRD